ncbi:MAG: tRNA (adenosine(37)-N6)-threonylcarbamoyltransferase complex transferase subunit TsaD [Patescibacteria group bacterium]
MLILGIESSCDDTSVALVECSDEGHFVIAEKTASQIDVHVKYGGVVPEIAGRMHAEKIVPLIEEVLKHENTRTKEHKNIPDAIAVTTGPGLITGLIVGTEAARTLSFIKNIPLVSVNHIAGHIHSVELSENQIIRDFPALILVVSGGHTELVLTKDHGDYEILGKTKDDAAGECFDKVAKLLGLPYPGGPQISKLAETGNSKAINFPRPMLDQENLDFSFAGLKTSALYWLRDHTNGTFNFNLSTLTSNDFCASIEQAIVDVLVVKTLRAAETYKPKTIILCGGVAANQKLRETLRKEITSLIPNSLFLIPSLKYCMDNAAMIAVAGYYHAKKGQYTDWRKLSVNPNLEVA